MGICRKKLILAIPAVIFGTDGVIKHRIDRKMDLGEQKEICNGKLLIRKQYNEGAAFGIFASRPKDVTIVQGVFLSAVAACYAGLLPRKGKTGLKISLGMLLGGGLSNFCDRLAKRHVVDYISVPAKWKRVRKIVFNVSDVFIFAGAALSLLLVNRKQKDKTK